MERICFFFLLLVLAGAGWREALCVLVAGCAPSQSEARAADRLLRLADTPQAATPRTDRLWLTEAPASLPGRGVPRPAVDTPHPPPGALARVGAGVRLRPQHARLDAVRFDLPDVFEGSSTYV